MKIKTSAKKLEAVVQFTLYREATVDPATHLGRPQRVVGREVGRLTADSCHADCTAWPVRELTALAGKTRSPKHSFRIATTVLFTVRGFLLLYVAFW